METSAMKTSTTARTTIRTTSTTCTAAPEATDDVRRDNLEMVSPGTLFTAVMYTDAVPDPGSSERIVPATPASGDDDEQEGGR
jgi:hypothetical protein